jgi:pilus assembly protein CpaE
MAASISVVVIDSDTDSLGTIVKCIKSLGDHANVVGTATNFESGFEQTHKKRPMVVIMEIKPEEVDIYIERIHMILSRFPQVSIFAECSDRSAETILKVMRAGAVEYLLKPVSEVDLTAALQKIGRLWITKGAPEGEQGYLYAFYSPKGGVGATTLAINFAESIYRISKKPTVLVDLDLIAGDVSTYLNMNTTYSITDVTTNVTRLDASLLKGIVARHDSGIYILSEPKKIEEGVALSSEDLFKVLNLLRAMFSYVIIDTETGLNNKTLTALKMADTIVYPLILSLPGIKNTQRYLSYFDMMELRNKIMLVVNRHIKKSEIKVDDAERILKKNIAWSFPNDYEGSMLCLNKGVTLSVGAPKSQLHESVNDFVRAQVRKK